MQSLLHSLADGLVVVGQAYDRIPVQPDRMHIDVSTREALRVCVRTREGVRERWAGACSSSSCEPISPPCQ